MRDDILRQPAALRALAAFYATDGAALLQNLPSGAPTLTGMGASYHAALATLPHFRSKGIVAQAIESIDLVYYGATSGDNPLIFVSQSGESGEVAPVANALAPGAALLGLTNTVDSQLGRAASRVFPLFASSISGVALSSYLNSLAVLWLFVRSWGGAVSDTNALGIVADRIEQQLESADAIADDWLERLGSAQTIFFVGHGPQAATARQAALLLAERARVAAYGSGIGAFRHGPIEIVGPGAAVVVFSAPGNTQQSALALAEELPSYGAQTLIVEQGQLRGSAAATAEALDVFLSPLLDIIPVQLFADRLARARGIAPGFRYITTVVSQL